MGVQPPLLLVCLLLFNESAFTQPITPGDETWQHNRGVHTYTMPDDTVRSPEGQELCLMHGTCEGRCWAEPGSPPPPPPVPRQSTRTRPTPSTGDHTRPSRDTRPTRPSPDQTTPFPTTASSDRKPPKMPTDSPPVHTADPASLSPRPEEDHTPPGAPLLPHGPVCYCDSSCVLYRDCCTDFRYRCLGNASLDIPDLLTTDFLTRRAVAELLSCQNLPYPEGDSVSVQMVSACALAMDESQVTFQDGCLGNATVLNREYLRRTTPVVYGGLLYRNYACLRCNHRQVADTNVTVLTPQYTCYTDDVIAEAEALYREGGGDSDALIAFLLTRCSLVTNITGVRALVERALCDHVHGDVTCYGVPEGDMGRLDDACAVYGARMSGVQGALSAERNCSACEGLGWLRLDTCTDHLRSAKLPEKMRTASPGIAQVRFHSFSILLDFTGGGENPTGTDPEHCGPAQFRDVIRDVCVEKSACADGQAVVAGECADMNVSYSSPEVWLGDGYNTLWAAFILEDDEETPHGLLWELVAALSPDSPSLPEVKPDVGCNHTALYRESQHTGGGRCFTARLLTPVSDTLPLARDYVRNVILRVREAIIRGNPAVQAVQLELSNFYPPEVSSDACPLGELRLVTDLAFPGGAKIMAVMGNQSWGFLPGATPSGARLSVTNVTSQEEYFVLICQPEVLTCDGIHVNESSVTWNGTDVMVETALKKSVRVKTGSYAMLHDGHFWVCVGALGDWVSGTTHTHTYKQYVDGILSATGLILSVIALLITMVTYRVFPSMRTTPGLCVMNLSGALLTVQVLFLVAPSAARHPPLCTTLALLQHYLWLAAFLWMNLMAWKVYRTFSTTRAAAKHSAATFRRYALYAWGVPVGVVAVSALVGRFTGPGFRYGGPACWLSGAVGLGAFFGAPLALVILANLVLFALTVRELRKTGRATRGVNENTDQTLFRACVRLSSVMGFTWAFGFLANVRQLAFLWYLFILFNTLTGVGICAAFVCNARVLGLYRGLLRGDRGGKEAGVGRTSSQSTEALTRSTELPSLKAGEP